jgi:trehalose 6-phosphate synthase/phosphatase
MLGLSFETKAGGSICIPFNGRNVTITCSHAGIETSHLIDILRSDDAATSLRTMWDLELNHRLTNHSAAAPSEKAGEEDEAEEGPSPVQKCQLIASADHAEGLRGITLKLLAFDRFLEERPQWRGRVRLLQIGIALDSRPDDARRVREDVTELVDTINDRYKEDYPDPTRPAVTYRAVKSFQIHERLALWRISSVMLSTCVRSGLDLHPLEYVFCRGSVSGVNAGDGDDESSPFEAEPIDSPGVVVLSEFSGCCRVLNGALHVNPYSTQSVVDALDRALGMSPQERSNRRRRDIRSIYANTKQAWIKRVLSDVIASAKRQDFIYVGTGFGLKYRMLGYGRGFTPLDIEAVSEMYRASSRRLIVIDYSGTLVEEQSMDQYMKTMQVDGRLQGLPLSVERNLAALCKNPQNTVYIVSGSDGDALSLAMSGVLARLGNVNAKSRSAPSGRIGLAGQHGFVYKPPGTLRWKCLLDNFDAEVRIRRSCLVLLLGCWFFVSFFFPLFSSLAPL